MSWRLLAAGGKPAPGRTIRFPHLAKKPRPVNLDVVGGLPRLAARQSVQAAYPSGKPVTVGQLMNLGKAKRATV